MDMRVSELISKKYISTIRECITELISRSEYLTGYSKRFKSREVENSEELYQLTQQIPAILKKIEKWYDEHADVIIHDLHAEADELLRAMIGIGKSYNYIRNDNGEFTFLDEKLKKFTGDEDHG
jgi:hypothetical protein